MGTTPDACDWFAIGARGNLKAVTSACQLMAESAISHAPLKTVTVYASMVSGSYRFRTWPQLS